MSTDSSQLPNQGHKAGLTRDEAVELFRQFTTNKRTDAEGGGAQLMTDNYILREDKRRLNEDVERLSKLVPPTGSVVLVGDDVKLFNDLKALIPTGKKVEDLAAIITEHGTLGVKVQTMERDSLIRDIAESEGWKPDALIRLTQGMDLLCEEIEVEVDDPEKPGQKKKDKARRGFLNVKDASGTTTNKKPLRDELSIFLPSLAKEQGDGNDAEGASSAQSGGHGTPFVRQSSGNKGTTGTKSISKDFLQKRYGGKKEESK